MRHVLALVRRYLGARLWVVAVAVCCGIAPPVAARAPGDGAAAVAGSGWCGDAPYVNWLLDQSVDDLYPAIRTASMSDYDRSMAVAASIQFYLQNSITRDQLDACYLEVTPVEGGGYNVQIRSADPRTAGYGATQIAWLKNGRLGLQGVQNCQQDAACWQPKGTGLACVGPWQFYLPLGLPMVSQKMVMLLHYPPYTAMQQSDYLNNATLARWQRLLVTVGVPAQDWTLYTTTVDIFPVAAPGSGQSGCFPTASATNFFGSQGSAYIPTMLGALAVPATPPTVENGATVPVVVFGAEAIGYWNAAYPQAPVAVNQAGSAKLAAGATRTTPYTGANHPIAAVYQTCSSKPGIETMVRQDLSTACFAKSMAATPGSDPAAVAASCQGNYFAATPAPEYAAQICITAVIDKSPQYAQWTSAQAKAWCDAHANKPCPLPDYASGK